MSTLLSPRRSRPERRPPKGRQESLFGALPLAPAPPEPAPPAGPERRVPAAETATAPPATETVTTARAHRQGPTLDDMVAGAWEGLLAGAPAACPVCETTLAPRYSAASGVVGGRCGGCGSTLG